MLETIWFVVWGLLWAIYFTLDGFDLGMGTLLPFLARNDEEKRVIYNAAGPYWDGNEVWLITAGGVTFAAFPKAYAVMFSALYAPLLILLFALIFRAVSFEFRNKRTDAGWKKLWDTCQFLGSALPALLVLSVAFLALTASFTRLYDNYLAHPALLIFPILAVTALLTMRAMLAGANCLGAWLCSALFIISVTFFGVLGMFPGIILSSLDPAYSITVLNGASSPLTLKIMLGVALVCVPVVICYQAWVFYTFAHRVTPESISRDDHAY